MSDQLYACKAILWRGSGELPQRAWPELSRGLWVIIDLWSGVGTLLAGACALGIRAIAICAECDPMASACIAHGFPNAIILKDVNAFRADMLDKLAKRRTITAVLVGGGSPCQGNSAQNPNRRGLQDGRTQQAFIVPKIAHAIRERHGVKTVEWLENAGSSPPPVIAELSEAFQTKPVRTAAEQCGYVKRNRLFWGRCEGEGHEKTLEGFLPKGDKQLVMPPSWRAQPAQQPDAPHFELKYEGSKPIPSAVHLDNHFQFPFVPRTLVAEGGSKALYPFVRCFPHPDDLVSRASPEAAARFREDKKRYPPAAYEERHLLWRGDEWRPASARERAAIHELPYDLLKPCDEIQDPEKREAARASLIGNGWHMGTFLVVLFMLFQLAEPCPRAQVVKPQQYAQDEWELRQRVRGSIFEPGKVFHAPGCLTHAQVVGSMRRQLPFEFISHEVWRRAEQRLQRVGIEHFQYFWLYQSEAGRDTTVLGPQWQANRQRACLFAATGRQRAAGDSKMGLDHLLPPGLGTDNHFREASQLSSPFRPGVAIDDDLRFAAHCVAVWGPQIPGWREQQQQQLRDVGKALDELSSVIQSHLHPCVARAAATKRPAHMAFLTAVMRWPDVSQAQGYIEGFPIIGEIPSSNLFRQLLPEGERGLDTELESGFFGDAAEQAINEIETRRPSCDADAIWHCVQDTIGKGSASAPQTRAHFDSEFGAGQWRPMPTFLVTQSCGKQRVINDAKAGAQNAWSEMLETIFAISVDFIATAAYVLLDEIRAVWAEVTMDAVLADILAALPHWCSLRISLDDIPDAYNGVPVRPDQARANIIALWSPPDQCWVYVSQQGLGFGLSSAVPTFCRAPTLAVAAARRVFGTVTAAYYDDCPVVEVEAECSSGQQGLQAVLSFTGTDVSPEKSIAPAPSRVFLGTACQVGTVMTTGEVGFSPKESTIAKIQDTIDIAQETQQLTLASAQTLRGQMGWAASNTFGKVGRTSCWQLRQWIRERGEGSRLADVLRELQTLKGIFARLPMRQVRILGAQAPPLLIYSDASWGEAKLNRVGWVVYDRIRGITLGWSMVISSELQAQFEARDTQIIVAEALALLTVGLSVGEGLAGRDCLWFIDNEAVASAAIRGSSGMQEVSTILDAAVVTHAQLGARIWFEWIDSKSNPSDGLSREGTACETASRLCTAVFEFPPLALLPTAEEMLQEVKNVGNALIEFERTVAKV